MISYHRVRILSNIYTARIGFSIDVASRYDVARFTRATQTLEIRQLPRKIGINKHENKLDAQNDQRHSMIH